MNGISKSSRVLVAAAWLMLVSAGCGSDEAPTGVEEIAGYVASTNVPSGDDYVTLVGYLSTLDTDEAKLASATEHAGFAGLLRSPAAPTAYFVGSGESPTITRYDEIGGKVVAGPSVSFASLGFAYAPGSTETAMAADGRAYSINVDQALIAVWNVDTMELERIIELPGLTRDGFAAVYPLSTTLSGSTLLVPVSYTNWDSGEALPITVLVSVDLENDGVSLAEDDRCSGIRGFARAADGTLYGATDGFFAVRRRLYGESAGTEPCVLRVLPGETQFDPDFQLASRALFDAAIVGDLSITADGESILFNVFDEQESPIAEDAAYADVASAPGWRVHRAPMALLTGTERAPGTPIRGVSYGARQGLRFNIDGRSWLAVAAADYGSSQLIEVSKAGAVEGPRFTGSVSDIYEM